MRILLVEDETDLGSAIKRVLTQETYLVDWVQDTEPMSNVVAAQVRLLRRKLAKVGCDQWLETIRLLQNPKNPSVKSFQGPVNPDALTSINENSGTLDHAS